MTRPRGHPHANRWLGAVIVIGALAVAFLWVPLDTATGLIEKVRRQVVIGDALAPMVAVGFLMLGGLLVLIQRPEPMAGGLSRGNLRFLVLLLALFALGLALMRWAGPAAVAVAGLLTDGPADYRSLRDTVPWKYIGFVLGNTVLVTGLIGWVEGRLSWRGLAIGLATSAGLIAIYDLPFDDLLLPPNGDV